MKAGEGFLAVVSNQVLNAPCVCGLIHPDSVTQRLQFRDNAAEKVRIPVIPVRQQRVTEDDYAHDWDAPGLRCTCSYTDKYSFSIRWGW